MNKNTQNRFQVETNSLRRRKKRLGAFYTTNAEYVLQGLTVPSDQTIIEPFVGSQELIKWAQTEDIEMYDMDALVQQGDSRVILQNTLEVPPIYKDKFVLTNPPYLARNKNKDKSLYDAHGTNDLYKVFLKTVVEGDAAGGIIILPLNFLAGQDSNVRTQFFDKYMIVRLNIFEETVFGDTSNVVCAFQFKRGKQDGKRFPTFIFKGGEQLQLILFEKYGYRLAGEAYDIIKEAKNSRFQISRLVKGEKYLKRDAKNKFIPTNLFLCSTDTGSQKTANRKSPLNIKQILGPRICLTNCAHRYYGKETDRMFASISCNHPVEEPALVAQKFNERLEEYRKKYHSLFLTNFRNSTKHYARKRISYSLAFALIKVILEETQSKVGDVNEKR